MTMTLIETKTLGTAAASIEFTSIPQTYTDLLAVYSLRATGSSGTQFLAVNSSTANFTRRDLNGNGSTTGSSSASDSFIGQIPGSSYTANTFSSQQIYIPNYTSSSAKSFSIETVEENNATTSNLRLIALLWNNSAAITSLSFQGDTMAVGSMVSLYGILKGTDGIVVTS